MFHNLILSGLEGYEWENVNLVIAIIAIILLIVYFSFIKPAIRRNKENEKKQFQLSLDFAIRNNKRAEFLKYYALSHNCKNALMQCGLYDESLFRRLS